MSRIDRPRILLIDDERDIVDVIKKGLERKGFEVTGYTDPVEAIRQFKPFHYEVVITDIRMPFLNGFELYRSIRKLDDTVKIFFLTAFEISNEEAKLAFPKLAPNSFIKKPITTDHLVELIQAPPKIA